MLPGQSRVFGVWQRSASFRSRAMTAVEHDVNRYISFPFVVTLEFEPIPKPLTPDPSPRKRGEGRVFSDRHLVPSSGRAAPN
jgi:hypothetical protein